VNFPLARTVLPATGLVFSFLFLIGCSDGTPKVVIDPMTDKGIGPVTSVELGPLDSAMAEKGKMTFILQCTPCHNLPDVDAKKIGPSLKGIVKRRTPEWIMNQVMNPIEMSRKDPIAQELLNANKMQMVDQLIKQDEARGLLEYFRSVEK
jgi:hypothetical protein